MRKRSRVWLKDEDEAERGALDKEMNRWRAEGFSMGGGLVAGVRIAVREWQGESPCLVPRLGHVSRRTAWGREDRATCPAVLSFMNQNHMSLPSVLSGTATLSCRPVSLHSRHRVV